jgi:hypothetical protein
VGQNETAAKDRETMELLQGLPGQAKREIAARLLSAISIDINRALNPEGPRSAFPVSAGDGEQAGGMGEKSVYCRR